MTKERRSTNDELMPMLMLDSGVRHGGSVLRRPREAIPIQVACESPARECLLSLRAMGQAPSGRWPDLYKDRGSHHDASGNSHARRDLVRTLAASQRDR